MNGDKGASHEPVPRGRGLVPAAGGFLPAYRIVHPEDGTIRGRGRLFVLHGFFGSGRNWAGVARGIVRSRPDWEAVLVDLRLHGDSLDAPPPHDLTACALDVARLSASLGPTGGPTALLGHSFGGKVALVAADRCDPAPAQAWIVDSTPAPGRTGAGALKMMDLLTRLPARYAERRAGADAIEAAGFPRFVAEWMATNLVRQGDTYAWRFDRPALGRLLEDFFRADLWPIVEEPPDGAELRFLRATRSSILREGDAARIARLESEGASVRLHELEGGHWLNVDNPDGVVELVRKGLPRA
jgi:pimeloyl-ACP methyl ester carboxylesterase